MLRSFEIQTRMQPGLKKAVQLSMLFFLLSSTGSARKVASFKNLNNPEMIIVHKQRIYFVDSSEVKVFSLTKFNPLFKFGCSGVGPGELFRNEDYNIQMHIIGKYIYLNSRNKIIQYTMTGKVVKENTFRFQSWQIVPLVNYFAMVIFNTTPNHNRMLSLKIVNSQSQILKILYSFEFMNPNRTRKFLLLPHLLLVRPYRDKIFVLDRKNGFPIMVFNQSGKLINQIQFSLPKIRVTERFKDEVWTWLELNKKWKRKKKRSIKMVFPIFFPDLKNFVVNDNLIYCQTYKKKGRKSEFLILDFNGKLIKKIYLPNADRIKMDLWIQNPSYAIAGNRYYYLRENLDQESWELWIENIN